jgi:hypothetical protein
MTLIPRVEANAKQGAVAVLEVSEIEGAQIRCCYCKCSVSGCPCPAFAGPNNTCDNCGHAYHDHWG